MTDFERRIKTKLIEDEYAEKFRQLDTEESIAHSECGWVWKWNLKKGC